MNVQKTKLSNGLTIITEDNETNVVTVKYVVNAGSFDEKDYIRGIAHFTEHMLFKGTINRTAEDINEDIAKIGGYTNAYTSYDRTAFYISCPAEHCLEALDILNDLMFLNTIPVNELEKERTVILEEIKMYEDSPKDVALEQAFQLINKGNEYHLNVIGTKDSVKSIQQADIADWIENYYSPNNVALIIAGKVNHQEVVTAMEEFFKDLLFDNKEVKHDNLVPTNWDDEIEIKKDISQAHLCFMLPGVKYTDERYYTQLIAISILGNGFTSRLFKEIREERGLAYTVNASDDSFKNFSCICGYAGLDEFHLEEVKELITDEIEQMCLEGISESELKMHKEINKGLLLLGNESSSSHTSLYEDNFLMETEETMEDIINAIDEVTLEDVNKYCSEFFDIDKLAWSFVIPKN